jgi:ATP-dependent RNA helicase DeaD
MTEDSIDLEQVCARLGFAEIPEVLEAAATPIRRGHHLALLAGEGSGKASVVGLAVLETCDPVEEALQALILVPEAAHAWRMAAAVRRVVGPDGFVVACPSAAPEEDRSHEGAGATARPHVLVGRPSNLLPEIRAGRHSISALRLLVLDRVADLRGLSEWDSVEPILETLPKECRKIAISDRIDPGFTRLIERQFPRARRWPEELLPGAAGNEAGESETPAGVVRCALAPATAFGEAFERCVRDADGLGSARVDLVFASTEGAARAAAELAVAGLDAAIGENDFVVSVALPGEGPAAVVQVGLPFRLDALVESLADEGPRYAVIEPRHAPQMELHVRRMNRRLEPLRGRMLREELDPVRRYRTRVREAAESADLMSELLILEPLFDELGAVRVAAVLSDLLRRRDEERGPMVRPWADVEAASTSEGWPADRPAGRERARRRAEEVPRGARPAWTRLYFGVGRRDEVKPGDLVGAITGEAGVAGAQIGKIEIMGNFSLVDIDSQVADEVMRKLEGVQIRGRSAPVRRDRES